LKHQKKHLRRALLLKIPKVGGWARICEESRIGNQRRRLVKGTYEYDSA